MNIMYLHTVIYCKNIQRKTAAYDLVKNVSIYHYAVKSTRLVITMLEKVTIVLTIIILGSLRVCTELNSYTIQSLINCCIKE